MKTERKEYYFVLGICFEFCTSHFGDGGWKTVLSVVGMVGLIFLLLKGIENGKEEKDKN